MTISVLSFQAISNPPLRLPFSTFNHHRPSRNFVVCSAKPVVPPALKHTAAARIESLSQVSGVLASQWGNEGKENLVEILAPHFDIVAIYQGGASIPVTFHNFKGKKIALDLIPSGILNEDTICVIGNGVAVHVPRLVSEIDYLESNGVSCKGRILISDRAPLLFDFHQQVNELCDYFIGSALAGLGPCYANKVIRNGIRVSDLRHMDTFPQKLDLLLSDAAKMVENFDYDAAILVEKFDYGPGMLKKQVEKYKRYAERLEPFIADTVHLLNEAITQKKKILVVGEEATMFDIDFGTYPIVTTSSTSAGGICTGLGIAPRLVGDLIGVVKAYTPKFGIGPFPTEVLCGIGPPTPTEMVEAYKAKYGIGHFPTENWSLERYQLRHSVSKELGNHARLAQRCGWLDIIALKYSCQINGFSSLYLSRLDVLSDLDKIQLGVSYKHYDGTPIQSFPADLDLLKQLKVEYEVFPGWRSDISSIRNYSDLPKAAQQYVERIEELVGVPIHYIGVGPGRDDVIFK